ncbi:MAG: fused response regulator/phosphatase [Deltaproteobacteria bacterium]|nr:fused response regulator/phosphatase [Deltaproteobacteria bacterium]
MPLRILIVDDDAITRDLLQLYLGKWGYECTLADDGAHAWELFQKQPFDIVLTDWLMPGLQGPDLCAKIRAFENRGYTYIILCTVKGNNQNIVEGIEAGADDYVAKPFDHSVLKVRVEAGARLLRLERSLAATNARLQNDLEQAATTLTSMLPARRQGPDLNLDWLFRPSTFIGGDLFNVFALDEKRTSIFSIDVSGHGVASALFAVTLGNMLRPRMISTGSEVARSTFGVEDLTSPAQVAKTLNERFPLEPPTDMYFTLFYAVLDQTDLSLRWVRAGHPPPIIVSGESVQLLEEGDPPIGFFADYPYTEHESKLHRGDRLFLYSDGITESASPSDIPFGIRRLQSELVAATKMPLNKTIREIERKVFEYRNNDTFDDDLSLLGIELS